MDLVGESGCFRRHQVHSEPKLLELIDALLTTTGCGRSPQRPQPIDLRVLPVNEFVAIFVLNLPSFWLAGRIRDSLRAKARCDVQNRPRKGRARPVGRAPPIPCRSPQIRGSVGGFASKNTYPHPPDGENAAVHHPVFRADANGASTSNGFACFSAKRAFGRSDLPANPPPPSPTAPSDSDAPVRALCSGLG
jgi:hypothetical protein